MIEVLNDFPDNVVAVACQGHVTRHDYEAVLIPAVENALQRHRKIRLFYHIKESFEGVDASAVWEDFKIGIEHLLRWERIAVITDVRWIVHTIKAFSFVLPGDVRVFPGVQAQSAYEWIVAD
ncbi:STAS/SEC14 domain-containing protein [Aestuariicella hydrocarbonica]|uniref:STAS/SEC14 domain-containing protein n=1 Tax=Pseudomaricurvus hydrocarbonicus TaxID=1470433 RepID=A0A9E5JUK5_9GAMM|nr:STAS/SEC14 domain-containing protein [Aestuariicella hydrocarbonica]NHO65170.1 STAS/SEC14 domain-containing protein [Aestuariicella hydrocarbonica]